MATVLFQPQKALQSQKVRPLLAPFLGFLCFLWQPISAAGEKHWAFVPPTREADRDIDWFVERRLKEKGIGFADVADRLTLARRVALTLTGLPLKVERVKAFAADESTGAYAKLVDELLASERFGEHQARYWLDAVRYADTHGLHMDNRRAIYPYRDWVIRAFNSNLPLNQFIKWQIAGDLHAHPSPDQLLATGFIRLNPTTGEDGSLYEEFQAINSFDRVETMGTALLGMTFSCARCHDHKYDPISQEEYFRLMAYFNNTEEASLDGGVYQYGPVIRVPNDVEARREWRELMSDAEKLPGGDSPTVARTGSESPGWSTSEWRITKDPDTTHSEPDDTRFFVVGDLPGQSREDLPDSPEATRWVRFKMQVNRSRLIWIRYGSGPGHRLFVNGIVQTNLARTAPLDLDKGDHVITIKLTGTPNRDPVEVYLEDPLAGKDGRRIWAENTRSPQVMAWLGKVDLARDSFAASLIARERKVPRSTRVLKRGLYNRPIGAPLLPGIPAVLSGMAEGMATNRMGLAQWLVDRSNPLVARVLVNRLWQQVFGAGLVRTPEDFGVRGERPTHPEVLDWLAVELVESGWDLKHVLRLLVSSRTFRQQSAWRKEVDDPENRRWARGPRFRLDAEVIRDLGLWAGGLLDLRMGGEGVKPWQPSGLWQAIAHPSSNTRVYMPDDDVTSFRRSVYLYWKRSSPHPMMTLFDAPAREASCVRRSRSNTAAQSLALLNERHRVTMAEALADRLASTASDAVAVEKLYWWLVGRGPRAAEREACLRLIGQIREGERDPWPKVIIAVMASDAAITLN